ncbi:hypothetical protein OE88DRAFT_1729805 [Heliocybe sulcata]|uniref:Thioesterase/thiol ester dehydrase-isomerase n=1 Tax=Heliocybe sulcata TaxID=5364 RepID=A0A5C3MIS5_9AGAM|nr:hypothetical protein OE88DRAFT_1729805 [Heliocybe sulcata]
MSLTNHGALKVSLGRLVTTAAFLRALVPSTVKGVFWILLLLNIRSFPLSWHFRVFSPVFALRGRYLWTWLKLFLSFKSKKERVAGIDDWYAQLTPIGEDPFRMETRYKAWAGPDDCDYNLHLSNSCYPKVLDGARFVAGLAMFPNLYPCGGWIALAGTHHHFIREIPIFAKYEIRMNVGSWDHKWSYYADTEGVLKVYIVIRFVTHSKKAKSQAKKTIEAAQPETHFGPSIHTPATPLTNSISATPANPIEPQPDSSSATVDGTVKQLRASGLLKEEEEDGATLHCVSVSQLCFKHGRITVPPALVFAINGFAADGMGRHSRANPPPYWAKVEELVRLSQGKRLARFLRGGWRDVPDGERWWEEAVGGDVERRRRERLEVLNHIRLGMDGARELD